MKLFIKRHCSLKKPFPSTDGKEYLTNIYRSLGIEYPKFFKMDNLSKLGFLASELIFKDEEPRFVAREDMAIICFNRSSSLESDTYYQATIQHENDYFPSPALFVYTLPNIVTGEIAIRNKLHGETSFYISEDFDAIQIFQIVTNAFQDKTTHSVLAAWVESFENREEVFMMLVDSETSEIPFTVEQIDNLAKVHF